MVIKIIKSKISRVKLKETTYIPDNIITVETIPMNLNEKEIFYQPVVELLGSILNDI